MSKTQNDIVSDKTFEIIQSAVNKMVDLIRPTFGPASNKVIIDKFTHRIVVDDGVQIARDFELNDPKENAVIKVIREAPIKTNDRAGDGTTGSLIILQAIIQEMARKGKFNGRKVELELSRGLKEVKKHLEKSAKQIQTREEILKVAKTSFDDEEMATLIADLYFELGKEGVITIDKSPTMKTVVEKSDGITLKSGYISSYMVNNPERMETELDNVHILVTDYRLTEATDVIGVLNKLAEKGKNNLLIIAENVEQSALATLVINLPHVINPHTKSPGRVMSVAVAAPQGENRKTLLEDIAFLTGATMFTESKGNKLEEVELEDLGTAKKAIIRREETIIVNPQGDKLAIQAGIAALRVAVDEEKDESKKEGLKNRLAMMTNKMAIVKVGASTDSEQRALKYKVEDAFSSVRAALNHGVVRGSGLALAEIKTSSQLLNEALKRPAIQLRVNMGLDEDISDIKEGEALNVVTGKIGPFLEVGVVDPIDVLYAGVESAISIASILLTSSGMIVESNKEE